MTNHQEYSFVIKPKRTLWEINFKELWQYRDLLMLLVKRDFISVYKQTILGPIWFFIQPLLMTVTFTIIFGEVAKIETGTVPRVLFYLTGITFWNYFSSCLTATSNTFVTNASVFGKVYFPRLIVPLSVVISNLMKLIIQFVLLIIIWVYYIVTTDVVHPQTEILFVPVALLLFALMGLGFGLIFSALTTKYRDLTFLIAFGVQLLMYGSAVIYPVSIVAPEKQWILFLNP
ncbi:MAG TPA: ABC transporter permease, partial [Bacteroidia bacterium]